MSEQIIHEDKGGQLIDLDQATKRNETAIAQASGGVAGSRFAAGFSGTSASSDGAVVTDILMSKAAPAVSAFSTGLSALDASQGRSSFLLGGAGKGGGSMFIGAASGKALDDGVKRRVHLVPATYKEKVEDAKRQRKQVGRAARRSGAAGVAERARIAGMSLTGRSYASSGGYAAAVSVEASAMPAGMASQTLLQNRALLQEMKQRPSDTRIADGLAKGDEAATRQFRTMSGERKERILDKMGM